MVDSSALPEHTDDAADGCGCMTGTGFEEAQARSRGSVVITGSNDEKCMCVIYKAVFQGDPDFF